MKILFVIDILDTNNNGTSISAQRFARELKRRGHEVRILCADPQEKDENGVALPVEVTGKYIVPEFIIPLFDPLVKKHGFAYGDFLPRSKPVIHEAVEWADVVHTFFPFPFDMVASKYAAKIGKPNTGVGFLPEPLQVGDFLLKSCHHSKCGETSVGVVLFP